MAKKSGYRITITPCGGWKPYEWEVRRAIDRTDGGVHWSVVVIPNTFQLGEGKARTLHAAQSEASSFLAALYRVRVMNQLTDEAANVTTITDF